MRNKSSADLCGKDPEGSCNEAFDTALLGVAAWSFRIDISSLASISEK